MKLITADRVKVRTRNSFSDSTGSAARRSTATNATISTAPSTARPMICHEAQGQVLPPREATSTRQVATEAMSRVPR